MARRLISLRELDDIEGLIEHHLKLQERIEALEAEAAQFDVPAQDALELSRKANSLKKDLAATLERLLARIRG
jgi:cell division septum initiation protein DivIVA